MQGSTKQALTETAGAIAGSHDLVSSLIAIAPIEKHDFTSQPSKMGVGLLVLELVAASTHTA